MNQSILLTLVTFLPLVGAVVIAVAPLRWARLLALGAALLTWVVSLVLAAGFDAGAPTPVRRVETRRQPDPEPPAVQQPSAPRTPPPVVPRPATQQPSTPPRRTVVFEDDLDVPDFLK